MEHEPAGSGTAIKECPSCAESVQSAAKVCRYCGYDFESGQRPSASPSPTNGLAVAALVLGIIGVVFGLLPLTFFIALVCGVLALIFGALGWRKANRGSGRKGMAIAGFILGLAGLGLGIAGIVIVDDAVTELDRQLQEIETEFGE